MNDNQNRHVNDETLPVWKAFSELQHSSKMDGMDLKAYSFKEWRDFVTQKSFAEKEHYFDHWQAPYCWREFFGTLPAWKAFPSSVSATPADMRWATMEGYPFEEWRDFIMKKSAEDRERYFDHWEAPKTWREFFDPVNQIMLYPKDYKQIKFVEFFPREPFSIGLKADKQGLSFYEITGPG